MHGTAIAEWLAEQRFCPIYLVRHPIPSALSIVKSGTTARAEANLRHAGFRTRFLDERQVDLGWSSWIRIRVGKSGPRMVSGQHGSTPGGESKTPAMAGGFLRGTVAFCAEFDPILGRRLGLDHPERMLRALRIPSPSTHGDSHAQLQDEDPMEQIRTWQGDVDSETEAGLFRIVDRFDIDIYRRGSAMPDQGVPESSIGVRPTRHRLQSSIGSPRPSHQER